MKARTILDNEIRMKKKHSKNFNNNKYHNIYNFFYCSKAWKELRKQKFNDANGMCEECLQKGIMKKAEEVHHIIPIEEDWDKRLDYSNLICLCKDCHNAKHERISQLQKFNQMWESMESTESIDATEENEKLKK